MWRGEGEYDPVTTCVLHVDAIDMQVEGIDTS
jgi:hypothetical protein